MDQSHLIIAKRLKTLLQDRNLTAAELARLADVRTSFIYDVLSGKSLNPSTITLARVANALAIPLHELLGTEFKGFGIAPKTPSAFISVPKVAIQTSASGEMEIATVEDASIEHYTFRRNWVRDTLKTDPKNLRLLDISGDSMQPTLNEKDIILIDTTRQAPSPPGIFVLFDGFGLVAKRLELLPHSNPTRVSIISDNKQYATYEQEVKDIRIIGRVVWFAREL